MASTDSNSRIPIPAPVRQRLWIAAAGRCEFRGCNKPVNRDFLTKRTANVGELAHIVADSPIGPRGDVARSKLLTQDEKNLMLMCFDCHHRVDRPGDRATYPEVELLAMKREHEARMELIYTATGVKDSLPLLMAFPIGAHRPVIDVRDIQHAILTNSGYKRFPVAQHIQIDRADFDISDGAPEFWARANEAMEGLFQARIQPALSARNAPTHLTIAAFAPIPLLMKLGSLLGDKMDTSVMDLPNNRWLWQDPVDSLAPSFQFEVPTTLPREVAVEISISNSVQGIQAATSLPVVTFAATSPGRGILCAEAHVLEFRRRFNDFLLGLVRAGARILHLFPASPLSASVEIGRLLLAKTVEEVWVWEYQAPTWRQALRIR